jgi:hypothetical protein
MRREVEAAVALYVCGRSPLPALEWMRILNTGRGPVLGLAIRLSMQLMEDGVTNIDEIVARVKEKYGSAP